MEGKIIHGGNPVLRWMAGSVVMRPKPARNQAKAKSPENRRIVAAIMAG